MDSHAALHVVKAGADKGGREGGRGHSDDISLVEAASVDYRCPRRNIKYVGVTLVALKPIYRHGESLLCQIRPVEIDRFLGQPKHFS